MQNPLFDYFQVKKEERAALSYACLWFMTLLGGYYMVRPVRDALGSEFHEKLKDLFLATFVTMLIVVPLYLQLVSRFPRRVLVPVVYRFLMVNLLIFAAVMHWGSEKYNYEIARAFFVWVSVYVLFAMSLFWSVMADAFTTDQGKRLFGMVAGCGTIGALLGSGFAGQWSARMGLTGFLLVPAALMEVGLFWYRNLERCKSSVTRTPSERAASANPLAGFRRVVESPYLLSICGYILITSLCGTSLYLTQAGIVNVEYPLKEDRIPVFAWIDFATQSTTVVLQFLVAGHLMRYSLPLTLAILPAAYLIGFAVLGFAPVFAVLVPIIVLTRATVYGVTVPAQGVLFTVVSRDDKYKAKNIIDTLVTRGGDAAASSIGNTLRVGGIGVAVLSWAMIPLTIAWLVLATILGRNCVARVAESSEAKAE
jgi:ATP:ADP antiporter, AAA family